MMATQRFCPSCLTRLSPKPSNAMRSNVQSFRPSLAVTSHYNQTRGATQQNKSSSSKGAASSKKKKAKKEMWSPDLTALPQYSLVDAMRYIRASEVGQEPRSAKYELHVRLRTLKSGPVLRGQLQLPHAVNRADRVCVIAAPGSPAAQSAIEAGASLVGEDTVFDAVKEGRIEFEKCICHEDSLPKLSKAGIARILGPRGLMPSLKLGTVVKNTGAAVRTSAGGTNYRERMGVVRLGIGQLGHTPIELQANIKFFMSKLKRDMADISDKIAKDIHEVVLSSTHGPGISLTGALKSADSPDVRDLSTVS